MKASYFLASFLTSFLFLLSFLRASVSMHGRLLALASSQCCWSPKTHTWNFGRGMCFSLTVPEKRLSFWGS
uniref:Putative secreted protein n=1 Tax=Ixodes ricinus TaxID=34613 RepID=A0A6B0U2D0_IXORI